MADEKFKDLTVPELREELQEAGQPADGKRDELVERLEEVKIADGSYYAPDRFAARFDSTNPPDDNLGPVQNA